MSLIKEQAELTSLSTAAALTYTAEQLRGGIIARDPNGADRTDTTPTATQIIAQLGLKKEGDIAKCYLVNTGDGSERITVVGGTGVTVVGDGNTLPQNAMATLLFRRTTGGLVTLYMTGQLEDSMSVRTIRVELENDEILLLYTTPFTLIPAPGANKMILPRRVYAVIQETVVYTGSTGAGHGIVYDNAAQNASWSTEVTGNYYELDAQRFTVDLDEANVAASGFRSLSVVSANSAMQIYKLGENYGGGDSANCWSFLIEYQVLDTTMFA